MSILKGSPSVAYTLDGASYDNVSFNFSSQGSLSYDFEFNNDGTKIFIIQRLNSTLYQYSLSTPYDISSATYDNVSFSFGGQGVDPLDIVFNNNGTKMYTKDIGGDVLYQYSLSTAFNIGTASYDNVSFSINAQDTIPIEVAFNDDGSKMYMLGNSTDSVYQYSLSTPFNIGTASYDNVSISIASQGTDPIGLAFSNDGSKMFMTNRNDKKTYQYTLSTPFDLSTASYDNFNISWSEPSQVFGLTFSKDESKVYIVGNDPDIIYQYSMGGGINYPTIDNIYYGGVTQNTFNEDFTTSFTPFDEVSTNMTYQIANNRLELNAPSGSYGDTRNNFVAYNQNISGDFTVSVDLHIETYSTSGVLGQPGIILETSENSYIWLYAGDGWAASQQIVLNAGIENGTNYGSGYNDPFNSNGIYNLKIERINGQIKYYVDDILEYTQPEILTDDITQIKLTSTQLSGYTEFNGKYNNLLINYESFITIDRVYAGQAFVFGTPPPGLYELIADVEVTSNTTQIDFDNLNITKDDELRLVYTFLGDVSTETNEFSLFVNDNTTLSNYYYQLLGGLGSSLVGQRANENKLSTARTTEKNVGFADIKISNNDKFVFQSQNMRSAGLESSNIVQLNYNNVSTFTITNINKLNVKCTDRTNGIGVGSRLQLYKVNKGVA